jgi:CubicO group peptidase (beta-lactamase class C family)
MRKYVSIVWLLALVVACSGPSKTATKPAEWKPSAELTARLAFLETQVEKARADNNIPGMALAVVKDGRMVFAKGFGVTDIDTNAKVTPETLFAIGSTTKAFTSTLIGMMVDEGKMSWDDALSKHIPGLTLQIESENADDTATVRDALCHRTGFSRMGVLFAAAKLDREEIFAYASKAKPFAGYHEDFLYNNITYLAAGVAGANAAGTTWEQQVKARILDPLGMTSTSVTMAEVIDDPRRSKGYTYFKELGTHKFEEMRNIDIIAPAGSINSNVIDMAKWLRLQLGGGEFEGTRLVSAKQLGETRKKHMEIAPGLDYGLGWMLHDWRGHQLVEHGGNIDGYAASVAMIPELNMGYVLLTNVSATVLQQSGMELVFDALVGDSYKGEEPVVEEKLEDYAGAYLASFAPLEDTAVTVVVKDGALAVDVPGQMVFDLKPPDENGRRAFAISAEIAVSFERDDAGNVVMMRLHQGGFDFELPREGSEFTVEVSEADAAKLIGSYTHVEDEKSVVVKMYRGRLAIAVPDMGVFQFDAPDAEGKRIIRANRDTYVTFAVDGDGVATGLTVFIGKEEAFVRASAGASTTDSSLAAVKDLRAPEARAAAIDKLGLTRITGVIRLLQAGVEGTYTIWFSGTDKWRQEVDLGKVGWMLSAVNGTSGWTASAFDTAEQLDGNMLAQARAQHPTALTGDWSKLFTSIEYKGAETLDGEDVHVVAMTSGALPKATLYIDAKTGDVLKVDSVELSAFASAQMTTYLSDYREVGGLRFPFATVVESEGSGTMVFTVDSITSIATDPGALFPATLPADPTLSAK